MPIARDSLLTLEAYSKKRGVKLINLNLAECREMMLNFITDKPELWNEDIGVNGSSRQQHIVRKLVSNI